MPTCRLAAARALSTPGVSEARFQQIEAGLKIV